MDVYTGRYLVGLAFITFDAVMLGLSLVPALGVAIGVLLVVYGLEWAGAEKPEEVWCDHLTKQVKYGRLKGSTNWRSTPWHV